MAQFCVNIADDQIGLVISSMCGVFGYQAMVVNPNPANHPNPDFNPALPVGPDNLASIPPTLPNPDFDPNFTDGMVYNPEEIPNPDYNSELPTSEENSPTIPNPDYDPEKAPYWSNFSTIPNPDYNPPTQVLNPETPPQFVNRMTRQWLAENVRAYQAQLAAEAARLAALEVTQVEITDPYI